MHFGFFKNYCIYNLKYIVTYNKYSSDQIMKYSTSTSSTSSTIDKFTSTCISISRITQWFACKISIASVPQNRLILLTHCANCPFQCIFLW